MRQIKTIAIFLITLILTLPIYSSLAYGDFKILSISGTEEVQKEGQDDIGYRGMYDITQAIIQSDKPDVRCACNPNSPLDCVNKNGTYECLFIDDFIADSPQKANYFFYQFAGGKISGDAITGIVYVDGYPPVFDKFDITFTGNTILSAAYTLTDNGISSILPEGCSGVKKVRFYDNGYLVGETNNTLLPGTCKYNGVFVYPTPSSDGEHEFYAEADDYVGNTNSSSIIKKYIDFTPPTITDAYLMRGESRLSYISNSPLSGVKVVLTVTDSNMTGGQTRIFADLSGLNINPAQNSGYKSIPFACSNISVDVYRCNATKNIDLLFSSSSAKISAYLQDSHGNNITQEYILTFTQDITQEKSSLHTDNCNEFNGQCYVHPGKNFMIADIENQGAGFGSRQIFFRSLDFLGTSSYQAESCTLDSIWSCKKQVDAPSTLADGSKHEISLVWPSQDDVGNTVNSEDIEIIYDGESPALVEGPIFGTTGGLPFLKSNDQLQIDLWMKDEYSGVKKAYADLHEAIPGLSWVESDYCVLDPDRGNHIYKCTFMPGAVTVGPKDLNIKFNVTDYAGNMISNINGNLKIYSLSNNNMSFWHLSKPPVVDPLKLDRVTSQYIPGKLAIWGSVNFDGSNAKLLYAQLEGGKCTGIGNSYLANSKIFNLPPMPVESSTANVIVVLELRKDAPLSNDIDELTFKCKLVLTSAVDMELYPSEKHEVEFKVGVIDYGIDLPAGYQNRILNFKNELKADTEIDRLNRFFEKGAKTCAAIRSILLLWKVIQSLWAPTSDTLKNVPLTYPAGAASSSASAAAQGVFDESTAEVFSWICGIFDCTIMEKIMPQGYLNFLKWYIASLTADPGMFNYGQMASNSLGSNVYEASKKSIIVSVIAWCVPGVIYNLEKARQIDCMYVDCAERWTASGLNPYTCEAMRANSYCNFVYGSIFHAIPFSGLVDFVGNFVRMFTSDPWVASGMIVYYACVAFAPSTGFFYSSCVFVTALVKLVNLISGVINSYKSLTDDSQKDYCKEVLG